MDAPIRATRSSQYVHAVWLADGDEHLALKLMRRMNLMEPIKISGDLAATAFTGRPSDWKPVDSLKVLLAPQA